MKMYIMQALHRKLDVVLVQTLPNTNNPVTSGRTYGGDHPHRIVGEKV